MKLRLIYKTLFTFFWVRRLYACSFSAMPAVFDIRSVGSSVLNGGVYGIEASAVTTVVLSAALVLCLLFSRKISAAAHKNVPA